MTQPNHKQPSYTKELGSETFVFPVIFIGFFALFAFQMGLANTLNTIMNTAYRLLIDTVLYITAICVIMGAVSGLLSEFGFVSLAHHILQPLMKPVYGLPGVASLGVVTTFLSDNPAILALSEDRRFRKYFKKYQFPALTNLGTSFGMGLIVCTYMYSLSPVMHESMAMPVLFGLLGAVIKYPVSSVEADPASGCAARRKFGYFYSEKELFEAVEAETGAGGKRNPLAFILEAADDIAYATADIEDAFRKGFFDFPTFTHELRERGVPALWRARLSDLFDLARLSGAVRPEEAAIRSWLREMQDGLVTAAANSFIAHYDALMEGRFGKELLSAKPAGTLLAALKSVAYDYAFTSMSIYKTEIAANRILTFLLDHLVPAALVFDEDRPGLMEEKYLSLIPENYARVCRRASADADDAEVLSARIQMAADTVCGMTDSYAKDLYTELTGFL